MRTKLLAKRNENPGAGQISQQLPPNERVVVGFMLETECCGTPVLDDTNTIMTRQELGRMERKCIQQEESCARRSPTVRPTPHYRLYCCRRRARRVGRTKET